MGELAIPGQQGLAEFGRGGGKIATSINLDDPAGKKNFAKCFGDPDGHIQDVCDKTINVTDYLIHDYVKVDRESGEVKTLFRFCLIDKQGKVYDCGSEGLLKSFKMLIFAYGMPPWPDGLKLVPRKKKLPVGFTMYFELA